MWYRSWGQVSLPLDPAYAHITQFIKDVYLDSRVTVGLLSNVTASIVRVGGETPRAPRNAQEAQESEILTAAQTAAGRNFINEISGSTRMLCHGLLYVGRGNLEYIQEQIDRVPDIAWTTEYAQLVRDLPNCYAEIGTTWASSVVTFPTVAAHIMGQLMKFMGEDRIVFGSDSVWYGSPQWQIEALWRFQIPEPMRERYGYPELTESAKRKILGLTSAKLYGIPATNTSSYRPVPDDYESRMSDDLKTLLEFDEFSGDNMSRLRETYEALSIEPNNTRYGWMRVTA